MYLPRSKINEPLLGLFCYLFFFVSGIIFFIIGRENKFIRFHAMQSSMFFGGLYVIIIATQFFPYFWLLGTLLSFTGFVLWIVLMWKALQGEMYKMPYFGDLVQRQLAKLGQ